MIGYQFILKKLSIEGIVSMSSVYMTWQVLWVGTGLTRARVHARAKRRTCRGQVHGRFPRRRHMSMGICPDADRTPRACALAFMAAVTGRPMIHLSPSEFKRTATADLLGTSAFCIVRPVWSSLDLFLSSSSSSMSSVGRIYRGYLLKSFILFFSACKLFMSCTNPLY